MKKFFSTSLCTAVISRRLKYKLPVKKVIVPEELLNIPRNLEDIAAGARTELRVESDCFTCDGELVNSGKYSGLISEKAREEMLREHSLDPQQTVVQVQADEDLAYEAVQTVMQKAAQQGISRIEFSALVGPAQPLAREAGL